MRAISTLFATILIGSTAYAGGTMTHPHYSLKTKHYGPAKFTQIVASGYFNLKVLPKAGKPSVVTNSYSEAPISVSVHNHTLYLDSNRWMSSHYKNHPSVVVSVPQLNQLVVKGPVNVDASGVKTKGLHLISRGYGNINIQRTPHVSTIDQSGNNLISVRGVNNHLLALHLTGDGKLMLAGRTDDLVARLHHNALLSARKLQAQHVLIQAKNNSSAYVRPLKSIRAFAKDGGQIFYYRYLTDLTRYTVQSGNAFQMSWS